ncbi:YjgN family protein [Jannaschia sp. LMIT008]|uniref:YjgN family protein n=1 Tax=Jannaschia maritima TaxID=3032585 RepID=UPI002811C5A8|nr:YjgN family protein [Jannaschia sp. LMIT008]
MATDYVARARDKAAADDRGAVEAVRFDGTAREYFGIWIVNLLLSVVTLGIYSAWAKVRTQTYILRNTSIGGRRFDYHATGGQILKGRLIVVGALVAISILTAAVPLAILLFYVAAIFVFPLLIVRALKFNARNTSWSNVRFDFQGSYGGAMRVYIGIPILVALSLYTAWPFLTRARQRFFVENHRLGDRAFAFEKGIGGYYLAFLIAAGIAVIGMVAFTILFGGALTATFDRMADGGTEEPVIEIFGIYLALFLIGTPVAMVYRAMARNLMYDGTTLQDGHRFESRVRPARLVWIAVSNAVAVVLTLGLALPWARIRMTAYLARCTTVHPNGAFDDIAGRIEEDNRAIGDAYSDIEGLDIGGVGI